MRAIALCIVALTGCSDVYLTPDKADAADSARAPLSVCAPWGGDPSGVPFSDEQATNAVDFLDHATEAELNAALGIGPVTAARILAERPFSEHADPLAAIDAIPYVGARVLTDLSTESWSLWCDRDDGRQSCCVELACEGLGDTVSGVTLDDATAHDVLDWANRASFEELEGVCEIGDVIAAEIEAARPFRSLLELDQVPFVTPFQLREMAGIGDSYCPLQGSVADEWCALPGADCSCEQPTSCETWQEFVDGDAGWRDALPAPMVSTLDELGMAHDLCDVRRAADMELVKVVVYRDEACQPWGADVDWLQYDDVLGADILVQLRLDADLSWEVRDCDVW